MDSLIQLLDPKIIPFSITVIIIGKWLKRIKRPVWFPPLPLILVLISFFMMTCYGFVTSELTGGALVAYALLFGMANGITISSVAIVGYDIGHQGIKTFRTIKPIKEEVKEEPTMDEVITSLLNTPSKKVKLLKLALYLASFAIGAVFAGLISGLGGKCTAFNVIAWILFGGFAFTLSARIIFHLAIKDNDGETWQISIYFIVALLGWLIGILSRTALLDTFSLALVISMVLMAVGCRFLKGENKEEELIDYLTRELRYKFVSDNPEMGLDKARALGAVDRAGNYLTIQEMEVSGFGASAEGAEKYIKKAFNLDTQEKVERNQSSEKTVKVEE